MEVDEPEDLTSSSNAEVDSAVQEDPQTAAMEVEGAGGVAEACEEGVGVAGEAAGMEVADEGDARVTPVGETKAFQHFRASPNLILGNCSFSASLMRAGLPVIPLGMSFMVTIVSGSHC